MLDTKNICNSLDKEGFFVVKDYINPTCCEDYIKILEKLYVKRQKNNLYTGNHEYKVMYNYFFEYPKLFNLLYSKFTHKIISNLIDNDYVLISAAARNRQLIGEVNNQILASGVGWHNDARYVNNKLIKPSFSYFTILALILTSGKRADSSSTASIFFPESSKNKTSVAPFLIRFAIQSDLANGSDDAKSSKVILEVSSPILSR